MLKNNIVTLGIIAILSVPALSMADDAPAAIKALAVTACEHIIKLDYKELLPYSTDDAKYTLNHYIDRFAAMDQRYADQAIESMKAINCEKDTHVKDLGLDNYQATITGTRSLYVIQPIGNKPMISNFK